MSWSMNWPEVGVAGGDLRVVAGGRLAGVLHVRDEGLDRRVAGVERRERAEHAPEAALLQRRLRDGVLTSDVGDAVPGVDERLAPGGSAVAGGGGGGGSNLRAGHGRTSCLGRTGASRGATVRREGRVWSCTTFLHNLRRTLSPRWQRRHPPRGSFTRSSCSRACRAATTAWAPCSASARTRAGAARWLPRSTRARAARARRRDRHGAGRRRARRRAAAASSASTRARTMLGGPRERLGDPALAASSWSGRGRGAAVRRRRVRRADVHLPAALRRRSAPRRCASSRAW